MSVDYNSSSPEQISFDGRHGEDVTDFLRDVKRIALAEGQLHNDQWLIDYAETCLAGPALKWFLDLDDDVLASWRGLQKALIERFDSAQATLIAQQPAPDALQPIVRPAESSLPPTASELPPRELKCVLLGDSGVGKSSLLARFFGKDWTPSMTPTEGVRCQTRVTEHEINHHYWDLSGRSQYTELRERYSKGVAFFWAVYDVTSRQSFQNIRQWVALARQWSPHLLRIRLIGNKTDLHDERVVTLQEGEALARELDLYLHENTSAKSSEGVQRLHDSVPRVKAH